MRLAMISYGLPTPGRDRGGIVRVAHDLAQGLARRGHAVTVWSYDDAPPGALYTRRPLPGARFFQHPLGLRLLMGYFGNILLLQPDYGRPDAIIAHGDSLLLPLRGRPVLRVMHGSALAEALNASSPWRFAAQAGVYVLELLTAMTQPGRVVGVSENTRRWNPFVRRVIPNGVDLGAHRPDGEKTPQPSVLFVGAPGGRKRGARLVEWFSRAVRPRFPEATLDCVGPAGPAAAGVAHHTAIPGAELVRLYQRSWVFASPSRYEGFGLPYLEAMACGTPVLATPNPGSREVLGGGEFGALADDAEFPDALARLLGDAGERERLRSAGLRRAAGYSVELMVDRYEELLNQLAQRNAAGP